MSPLRFPEEVDVFTIPHSRMKHLVDTYLSQFSKTDFTDGAAMSRFLSSLLETFKEFQQHEQIENRFIMDQLKRRLSALSVYNSAVCNCHQDNRVTEMMTILSEGLARQRAPERERVAFRRRLCDRLREFTDNFLPHMEEEEQIFQPLLVQYFGYDELRELKRRVLLNHRLGGEKADAEKEPPEKPPEQAPPEETPREEALQEETPGRASVELRQLPLELLTLVLSHLTPPQRAVCARVCRTWRSAALAPSLWHTITLPGTGEGGGPEQLVDVLMAQSARKRRDSDADVDEWWDGADAGAAARELADQKRCIKSLTSHTLPAVGGYVRRLQLAGCRGLGSSQLRQLLSLCPNLRHLDASYTPIGDCSFKRLPEAALQRLQHCDLSGCERLTDRALLRLADQLDLPFPAAAAAVVAGGDIEEAAGVCAVAPDPECYDCESHEECSAAAGFTRGRDKNGRRLRAARAGGGARLRFLSLSGCRRVSGVGVARLARCRAAAALSHLDVSGCCLVSAAALHALQAAAPRLQPDRLWYCDFVLDGPHPELANGCDNVECPIRHCCRN